MLFNSLALGSLLILIALLRSLVNIFPSLLACTIRWKENVNLEMSIKLSRERNILAAALIIPFCLTAYRFKLYDITAFSRLSEPAALGATIGIFITYILLRSLLNFILQPQKKGFTIYNTAKAASRTFFIILVLFLMAISGILSFVDVNADTIKTAMIWISATIYLIFLVRKVQIFASSYNFFTVFLYLCALEIVPTGVLVTSVMIF